MKKKKYLANHLGEEAILDLIKANSLVVPSPVPPGDVQQISLADRDEEEEDKKSVLILCHLVLVLQELYDNPCALAVILQGDDAHDV